MVHEALEAEADGVVLISALRKDINGGPIDVLRQIAEGGTDDPQVADDGQGKGQPSSPSGWEELPINRSQSLDQYWHSEIPDQFPDAADRVQRQNPGGDWDMSGSPDLHQNPSCSPPELAVGFTRRGVSLEGSRPTVLKKGVHHDHLHL